MLLISWLLLRNKKLGEGAIALSPNNHKMKRFLLFFILILLGRECLYSQIIGKKAGNAIDYIYSGYIEYGVLELKQSAQLNDLGAQYYLAGCYEHGIVYETNFEEAFKLYRKTAERGLPDAMYKLSIFYQKGIGISQNSTKSREWTERFEKKGGMLLLPDFVLIYNEGLKHPENYTLNPSGQTNNALLALQNNSNISSNNNIGSNNQTINNITIVQAATTTQESTPEKDISKSFVDIKIPDNSQINDNSFALIIANENYQDVATVPNAINDGAIFAEYCKKTLGMPAINVTFIKDATFNNIKREISKLSQIASAYNGSARIVFYYAGHGVPNEATKDAFLLPVDGYGTDTSTGYSLKDLYSILGKMPAEQIVVLLDACFSGSQRGDGMLASARGIAIKAKPNKIEGTVVVLSAAQGDETAYPYQEEGHGLFTYYLLKKLQETNGSVSLGELAEYIRDNVNKRSIVVNGKTQTPNVSPSGILGESWKNWTLY